MGPRWDPREPNSVRRNRNATVLPTFVSLFSFFTYFGMVVEKVLPNGILSCCFYVLALVFDIDPSLAVLVTSTCTL